jgi:hypothetical protein
MKITMLFVSLLSCINVFAQDVPELPIKNDYVYYVFDHKLDNTKKCISFYNNDPTFMTNIVQKTLSLSTEVTGKPNDIRFSSFSGEILKCTDTISTIAYIVLPEKLPQTIFGDYKSGFVTVKVDIILIDKNNYKITFKAFTCSLMGKDMNLTAVDLEEFYSKFKENSKKTKYDIEVFTRIDNAVKGIDKLILESFKKAYQTDEL